MVITMLMEFPRRRSWSRHCECLGAAAVDFYLPSRFREGYGLHREALEQVAANGADLLITVDCGTNAAAEAACARSLGLDLIVTDHHQPFTELKGAVAVLNPLQEDCPYPFKELSGVGLLLNWPRR